MTTLGKTTLYGIFSHRNKSIIEATEHRVANVLRGRALRKQIARQRDLREESRRAALKNSVDSAQPPLAPETLLEPFTICIPLIPGSLDSLLYRLSRGSSGLEHGLNGQLIRKGEIIGFCARFPLLSPVDGKIELCCSPSEVFDAVNWEEYTSRSIDDVRNPKKPPEYKELLAKIQPVRGSNTTGYIQQTYVNVITRLNRYDKEDKHILGWFVEDDMGEVESPLREVEAKWMEDFQNLKVATGRFQRITATTDGDDVATLT